MASKAKKTTRAKVSSYWKGHIEAWQGSGKTQAEYCRQACSEAKSIRLS